MSVAIWVFGCCGWRAFRLFKLELTDFSVNQFFLVGGCRLEALLAGSFYGCRLMESLLLVVGDWLVLWIFSFFWSQLIHIAYNWRIDLGR